MEKNYIAIINEEYLRNMQVFQGVLDEDDLWDDNLWDDIRIPGFAGVYGAGNRPEELKTSIAEEYSTVPEAIQLYEVHAPSGPLKTV